MLSCAVNKLTCKGWLPSSNQTHIVKDRVLIQPGVVARAAAAIHARGPAVWSLAQSEEVAPNQAAPPRPDRGDHAPAVNVLVAEGALRDSDVDPWSGAGKPSYRTDAYPAERERGQVVRAHAVKVDILSRSDGSRCSGWLFSLSAGHQYLDERLLDPRPALGLLAAEAFC